jgi:hypothetical protein
MKRTTLLQEHSIQRTAVHRRQHRLGPSVLEVAASDDDDDAQERNGSQLSFCSNHGILPTTNAAQRQRPAPAFIQRHTTSSTKRTAKRRVKNPPTVIRPGACFVPPPPPRPLTTQKTPRPSATAPALSNTSYKRKRVATATPRIATTTLEPPPPPDSCTDLTQSPEQPKPTSATSRKRANQKPPPPIQQQQISSATSATTSLKSSRHDRCSQPVPIVSALAATETLQLLNDDEDAIMEIPHAPTTDEENDSDLDIPYETGHEQGQQGAVFRATAQRQREPLRPGDVICYNHPAFVAGTDQAYRRTLVVATTTAATRSSSGCAGLHPDDAFLLTLDNGECIPAHCVVKRVGEYRKGQLYRHQGVPRPITHFVIKTAALSPAERERLSGQGLLQQRLRQIREETTALLEQGLVLGEDSDASDGSDEDSKEDSDSATSLKSTSKSTLTAAIVEKRSNAAAKGTTSSESSSPPEPAARTVDKLRALRQSLDRLGGDENCPDSSRRGATPNSGNDRLHRPLLLSLSKHNRTNAAMGPVCHSPSPQAKLGQSKPSAFKASLASTKGSKEGKAKEGDKHVSHRITLRTNGHVLGDADDDDDDDDELPPSVFSKASILSRSANDPRLSQGSVLTQKDDSDDDLPPSVFRTTAKRSKVAAAALLDGSKARRITSFLTPLEEMQAGESDEELSPSALCFEASLRKASNNDSDDGLLRRRIPSFLKTSPKTIGNEVNKDDAAMKQAQIEEFRQLKLSSTAAAAKDGAKKRKAKSSSGSSTGTLSLQSRRQPNALLMSREKYNGKLASVLDGDSDGASDDESYFPGRTKEAFIKRRQVDDCADSITTTFSSSQSVTTQTRREPKTSKTLSRARRPLQATAVFRPGPLDIRKTTTNS